MSLKNKRIIKNIKETIVDNFSPEKIILFGSASQNKMKTNSDFDILVIKRNKNNRRLRRNISRYFSERNFPLDIIVRTPGQFKKNIVSNNPFFVEEILKKGKIIYEKQ